MFLEKGLNDSKDQNSKEFKDLHDSKDYHEAKMQAKNNKTEGFFDF